jgi:hypothetical protein
MIFQCHDLDRALQSPDLMPDALAHAENCEHCREELRIWNEISRLAPQLQQTWESPGLWPRIEYQLSAAARPRRKAVPVWCWALAAAAVLALCGFLWQAELRVKEHQVASQDLLTEQALREVQETEAAYARSIEKLSTVAGPSLHQSPAPLAAAYREKLTVLDAAIADLKSAIETNRYNAYLQTQLASLYRAKQKTLEEWLKNANNT